MKFYIIGIDDSNEPQLSAQVLEIIGKKKIFSGGSRHHKIIYPYLPAGYTWIEITPPMSALFESYANYDEIVVFASGDPLFNGFGSTLQKFNPMAEMELYPTFNSLQILAHKAQIAYSNMRAVTLTGRSWDRFDQALIEGEELIGILTDTKNHTPDKIAQRMLDYGYNNYTITVGELLGNNELQRINKLSVKQVAEGNFMSPNNMILQLTDKRKRYFGIPDKEFLGLPGRSKMITKKVIRLASISNLDLRDAATFWDVGFCTGSVSIEAKLLFPHLKVVSFEKREECKEIMEHNRAKFGAVGIDYHIGDFMECNLDGLPKPDSIFIGGHGGNLKAIVKRCREQLNNNGVLLFNSVSTESEELFIAAIGESNLTLKEVVTLKVDDFNTIRIIKTIK